MKFPMISGVANGLFGNRTRSENELAFLPAYLEIVERPPSPFAVRSALLMTFTLLAVLTWSILGQLDIHASASGQVIVSSRTKVVQPWAQGEVISIEVHDGEHVNQNDVLIRLNPVGAGAELSRIRTQYLFSLLEHARYEALLQSEPLNAFEPPAVAMQEAGSAREALKTEWMETQQQLKKFDADLAVNEANEKAIDRELSALAALITNIEKRLKARLILEESRSIAPMEVLEIKKELLQSKQSKEQLVARREILNSEKEQLKQQRHTYLAGLHKEYRSKANEFMTRSKELEQELVKAQEMSRLQTLRSPVTGTVQQLQVSTVGGVVQAAEKLMVIVPDNALLEVEVMLLNKDVGFVVPGQPVAIKIDTFPYTKYGTLSGEVVSVSKDAIKDERLGMVFPVRIRLSDKEILVENNWVALTPGMSVVAEIKTGRRRIIEYLLSPLQQYRSEALRER